MDPRITRISFRPTGRLWIAARVGMTLPELFALGLTARHICNRLPLGRLAFDPTLSRSDVTKAYRNWSYPTEQRRLAALAGHEQRRSVKGPRICLCCKKTFKSEGSHNRLCRPCKDRATATYDPW